MKLIALALWPILLADLGLHAVVVYLFYSTSQLGGDPTAGMRFVEAISALLVIIAAYRASALSGKLSTAFVAVALYWVVWKACVFGLTVVIAAKSGLLGPGSFDQAAIGVVVALLLFSPLALLLAWLGGYVGRRRAKGTGF